MTKLEEIKESLWPIRDIGQSYWVDHRDCILDRGDFNWLISRVEKLEAKLRKIEESSWDPELSGDNPITLYRVPFCEGETDPNKLNAPLIPLCKHSIPKEEECLFCTDEEK